METKLIEIRDRWTFIPALAIKLTPANGQEQSLLTRAGFGKKSKEQETYVLLSPLEGGEKGIISYDPFRWQLGRSLHEAHLYLLDHFDKIHTGDVVDVEYILGEITPEKPD